MVKNIVFDIGRVLIGWEPYSGTFFDKETYKIVTAAMFDSNLWMEFDRGVLEEEEIIRLMAAKAPGYEEQIRYFVNNIGLVCSKKDYAAPLIKSLKAKGYKVYYLSNYNKPVMRNAPDILYFLPEMDGGIFSCDVKLVKPDHRIYELLCEKYNLIPSECIFIDDRKDNVDGAIECGWQAILFTNYDDTIKKLNAILGIA